MVILTCMTAACSLHHSLTSSQFSFDPQGIHQALAESRAARVSEVGYTLTLNIPERDAEPVVGVVNIEFRLGESDTLSDLWLDFNAPENHVRSVSVAGNPIPIYTLADHIVVPGELLQPGRQSVQVEFISTDLALNRRDDYLYSLFVPERASSAFPLFDQPDIKARFTLTLDIPTDWSALSNAQVLEQGPGGPRRKTVSFAATQPISSYLFAFAAGRLQQIQAERDGRVMTLYHRETDTDRLQRNADAIFDLHAEALRWLEDYTGIPYPFAKFDFFAVPAFQFGGMEHPGAIWYRAESLFLDDSPTLAQQLSRANLIAHETAHMWFGDLVTMRWFDDVWLKEVFANFLAAKIAGPAFPELDLDLRFYQAHHPLAYAVDRSAGSHAIRQELSNLRDAGSLYGAIIYQKAPIVMQQLEQMMGADALQKGLRDYLQTYSFGNATWPELITVLDSYSELDLASWSASWVESADRPRIRVVHEARRENDHWYIEQIDDQDEQRLWPQTVTVLVRRDGRLEDVSQTLDQPRQPLTLGSGVVDLVLAGVDGVSYARFELDAVSRAALLSDISQLQSALHRAVAWQHLWEEVLEDRLPAMDLYAALEREIPDEPDVLLLQQMSGILRNLWWRYLSSEQRRAHAAALEAQLWQMLENSDDAALQRVMFDTLLDVSVSPSGVNRLRETWLAQQPVAGMALQETQFSELAHALALRDVPDADSILQQQLARIDNPDRYARFQFLMPAYSGDKTEREAFFLSFADADNRLRESWVLDAARAVHHPLRAADSQHLILPALSWLEGIRQTGDIFFPLRWLHAVLDGHRSSAASAVVTEFMEGQMDQMDKKLFAKMQQAADGLHRAAR